MEAKTAVDVAVETECKKYACAIQKCLSRRRPNTRREISQTQCQREISAWESCSNKVKEELAGSKA